MASLGAGSFAVLFKKCFLYLNKATHENFAFFLLGLLHVFLCPVLFTVFVVAKYGQPAIWPTFSGFVCLLFYFKCFL